MNAQDASRDAILLLVQTCDAMRRKLAAANAMLEEIQSLPAKDRENLTRDKINSMRQFHLRLADFPDKNLEELENLLKSGGDYFAALWRVIPNLRWQSK